MTTIALIGAAGKMGTLISNNLKNDPEYRTLYVEAGEVGQARLLERGLTATPLEVALREADVVILAIPDTLIRQVAQDIVSTLKSGTMVVCLDPAAPYAGELPPRADITYFVTHPCHPSVVSDEIDPEARMDFFGGIKAKQHVVCALMSGPESDYMRGERIVRKMFAPVMNVHRVTVEQMAILEPALSETVVATCMIIIREAMDEAIRRGVPAEAARDFVLGHINVDIGILFGYIRSPFSDGANLVIERAKKQLFQPDWKKVFNRENVYNEVKAITQGRPAAKAS
jgi:hypothetical protein